MAEHRSGDGRVGRDLGALPRAKAAPCPRLRAGGPVSAARYSHSIVAGGFELMS